MKLLTLGRAREAQRRSTEAAPSIGYSLQVGEGPARTNRPAKKPRVCHSTAALAGSDVRRGMPEDCVTNQEIRTGGFRTKIEGFERTPSTAGPATSPILDRLTIGRQIRSRSFKVSNVMRFTDSGNDMRESRRDRRSCVQMPAHLQKDYGNA